MALVINQMVINNSNIFTARRGGEDGRGLKKKRKREKTQSPGVFLTKDTR